MEVPVNAAAALNAGAHVEAGNFCALGLRYFGDAATV